MQRVKAISISERKGMRKKNIDSALLVENFGLAEDAHAGKWHRQVSLLAEESIEQMRAKGLDVVAGNFAENITTEGIDLTALPVGSHIRIGETELIISQLGKICHHPCVIYHKAGDCVMPREGIFGVVIKGGPISVGDEIEVLEQRSSSVAIVCSGDDEAAFGELLGKEVAEKYQPGVIRIDQIKEKENTLEAILNDLLSTQKVDRVVVFDPSGKHALAFAGKPAGGPTSLLYCKSLDDLKKS